MSKVLKVALCIVVLSCWMAGCAGPKSGSARCPCATGGSREQAPDLSAERLMLSEGYSLLYRDASNLDRTELILYAKVESAKVDEMVTAVAALGSDLKGELERIARDYPGVRIDLDPLPEMEKRKRRAIGKDRALYFAPGIGHGGREYERRRGDPTDERKGGSRSGPARDVLGEVLDRRLLLLHQRLDYVADRDHSGQLVAVHHEEMTDSVLRHEFHAAIESDVDCHVDDVWGHDLADVRGRRNPPHQDDLARVVALRNDADGSTGFEHQQRAAVPRCHFTQGVEDRCIGRYGVDHPAFLTKDGLHVEHR